MMDQITTLQQETIESILGEKTRNHWHDIPEVAPLLEQLESIEDSRHASTQYLMRLIVLAYESEGDQARDALYCLETVCATAEPPVLAQAVARFLLFSGEEYPTWPGPEHTSGWLEWSLEYKLELERRGAVAKKLWSFVKGHGLETEQLTIQWIVAALVKRRETDKENEKRESQEPKAAASERIATKHERYRRRDIVYMLHCGPLMDHKLTQLDEESVLNALLRMQDNADPSSLESQMLMLVNLLDRFFNWIEDSACQERIGQLKTRLTECAKVPELALFTMDSILRFLDGRWIKPKTSSVDLSINTLNLSLLDVNREREPIHYLSAGEPGSASLSTSKHAIQGRSLRAREVPKGDDRDQNERQFEIGDLLSCLIDGHRPEILEQLVRRFVTHLWMRVDTAMVVASGAAIKHAGQHRDKVLLRLMTENPAYKKIMAEFLDRDAYCASQCLPVIQGMLRCSIAHWTTCKNTVPKSYPKELEEATSLALLAEKTGLIPDPIGQAVVLFPLISSKDVRLILEQCYYVLLVRHADTLQQRPVTTRIPPRADPKSPELQLLRRVIFKHAATTFQLAPLFT